MHSRLLTHILLFLSLFLGPLLHAQQPTQSFTLRTSILPEQKEYFAGQTIRLILEFESRGEEVSRISNLVGLPTPEWAENRQNEFFELAGSSSVHDGETVHLRRFALDYQLLQSGEFEFQPRATVMLSRRIQRSHTAAFFGTSIQSHQVMGRAEPYSVTIRPLPLPAPTETCGLVGDFRLRASISPDSASPGDLINLHWSLQGIGNLQDFRLPPLPQAEGFKAYAPTVETDLTNDVLRVSQVFVPQTFASTNIPAFSVSFFNPVKATYETLSAGPFPLQLHERIADTIADFPPQHLSPTSSVPTASTQPTDDSLWTSDSFILPASTQGYLAPSSQSLKLRTLPAGTHVLVLERSGRWLRVQAGPSFVWISAPLSTPLP